VSHYAKIEQGVFVDAKSVIGPRTVFRDYVFVGNGAVEAAAAVVNKDVKEITWSPGLRRLSRKYMSINHYFK
jgi:hypothetical protein